MSDKKKKDLSFEGTERYYLDPELQSIVNIALVMEKPLLLTGEAGTGKTQVLTARVLRLLLSGVDPETILCLTFTKAGAAEMANRRWHILSRRSSTSASSATNTTR